jgi:hypothetical protein
MVGILDPQEGEGRMQCVGVAWCHGWCNAAHSHRLCLFIYPSEYVYILVKSDGYRKERKEKKRKEERQCPSEGPLVNGIPRKSITMTTKARHTYDPRSQPHNLKEKSSGK